MEWREPRSYSVNATWWNSGTGPGTITHQGQFYASEILSGGNPAGYIRSIDWYWSGNLRGWNEAKVYLAIFNDQGQLHWYADVTDRNQGTLTPPWGIPKSYRIAYLLGVERFPVLPIYLGPMVDYVSVSVR